MRDPSQFEYNPSIGIVALDETIRGESKPIEPTIYDQFKMLAQEGSTKATNIEGTVAKYKQGIARLDREYRVNFDNLSDKELQENRQKRNRLQKNIEEVTRKHEQAEKARRDLEEGQGLLCEAPTCWYTWSLEERQRLIRLATESITLDQVAEGWFSLTIVWSQYLGFNFVDTAYIWREKGRGPSWSEEENELLRKYYPTAPRDILLKRLPGRTWGSMRTQASILKLTRQRRVHDQPINMNMSAVDEHVLDTYGLDLDEPGKRLWWHCASKDNDGTYSATDTVLSQTEKLPHAKMRAVRRVSERWLILHQGEPEKRPRPNTQHMHTLGATLPANSCLFPWRVNYFYRNW